jgi:hypothetical protein
MACPFSACTMTSPPVSFVCSSTAGTGRRDHQDPGVGRKTLKVETPSSDHRPHVGDRGRVGVRDRHVEAVVDVAPCPRAAHPLLERGAQPARVDLEGEVDDAGRPARRGGLGAGVVVVDRVRAAERHRHVRVVVDGARQHVAAGRVDRLGVDPVERTDRHDLLALDQHVGQDGVDGRHDRSTPHDLPRHGSSSGHALDRVDCTAAGRVGPAGAAHGSGQVPVDERHGHRPLADRGRDPLHGAAAHVAGGEDAGTVGLEEQRVPARARASARRRPGPGRSVPVSTKPVRSLATAGRRAGAPRFGADEDEQRLPVSTSTRRPSGRCRSTDGARADCAPAAPRPPSRRGPRSWACARSGRRGSVDIVASRPERRMTSRTRAVVWPGTSRPAGPLLPATTTTTARHGTSPPRPAWRRSTRLPPRSARGSRRPGDGTAHRWPR